MASTQEFTRYHKNTLDLSIMPFLRCDLSCSFCMYDAGPDKRSLIDIVKLKRFISTIDWSQINSIGFYGGEIFLNIPYLDKLVNLFPPEVPRWCYTNGTWSNGRINKMTEVLKCCHRNHFHIVISGTSEHVPFQNRRVLELLKREVPDVITLKDEDGFHTMGRYTQHVPCNRYCLTVDRPTRVAVHPSGDIMFQDCKGSYPIVSTLDSSFADMVNAIEVVRDKCVIADPA